MSAKVAGIAMTKFGKMPAATLKSLTSSVVQDSLADAGVGADLIETVFFANAIGGSITGQEMVAGQVALRAAGIDGVPIFNVENACASASSAFHLATQAVLSGAHDVVLAVGAEKMSHPDKRRSLAAIGGAADVEAVFGAGGPAGSDRSYFMDLYAANARDHMERHGTTQADYAAVAVKNQRHGAANPRAQYGGVTTVDAVLGAREIVFPLTLPMCSPVSDGAAAAVVVSERVAERLDRTAIEVRATSVTSGSDDADRSSAVARAAGRAYETAGVGPEDVELAEVHDATASAEVKLYEELGFAATGDGASLIQTNATTYGGSVVVNPSGGLLAKGHPIGATGLAQIVEATEQLRDAAGDRQVPGARLALCQNAGGWIGEDNAVAAVTILERTSA